jgi:hypothetical protein
MISLPAIGARKVESFGVARDGMAMEAGRGSFI